MRGRRKQPWAAVLLLMTIQPEAWSSTEARFAKPIAEERVVVRVMSAEESVAQKVGGEAEKKGWNREKNRKEADKGCSDCSN